MKCYAGIGSRETPDDILKQMTIIASQLEQKGYILRSGGAKGADSAFEKGVRYKENKEIFTASTCTPRAIELAKLYHPAWDKCTDYVKHLHGRNMQILLGYNLDSPVKFIVCWTPKGQAIGGTGQGLRYAQANNIKIYNLYDYEYMTLIQYIQGE